MGDKSIHRAFASEFDIHDPQFRWKAQLWSFQTRCEMTELTTMTEKTIAASKELLAQTDRILARI